MSDLSPLSREGRKLDLGAVRSEPLTPDAFGDPHFGPKQVCAGALCAGCQRTATLRLANETRFGSDR